MSQVIVSPEQAVARFTEDDAVLVSVQHVSKKFCRQLKRSMAYGLLDLLSGIAGASYKRDELRTGEFWALQDLSFELRRGEALGVLGLNGSGKTTLLRTLAGIFPPDEGQIFVKGRVGALISMGTGFHYHMTGRENIYINGSLLGMSRQEIDDHFDAMVDFADIGDFLDAPVATYSSGMRVRLGFAIATAVVPDVLLLDEVFAVGDVVFRQRCIERIRYMIDQSAVILVSNRSEFIEMLCTRALWIDRGRIIAEGQVEEVARHYEEETTRRNAVFAMRQGTSRSGTGTLHFTDAVRAQGANSEPEEVAIRLEALIVEAPFTCEQPLTEVAFSVELFDLVMGLPLTVADCVVPEVPTDGVLRCTFENVPFLPRSYAVMLKAVSHGEVLDQWRYATLFTAMRLTPKIGTKLRKYPHEITVEAGSTSFVYTFEGEADEEDEAPAAQVGVSSGV